MMDNSFEKQIRDKVNQAEVSPADGLLDAIFEKRAARTKPFIGLGYTKLFLLTAVAALTAGVWFFVTKDAATKSSLASQLKTEPATESVASVNQSETSKAALENSTNVENAKTKTNQNSPASVTKKERTVKAKQLNVGRAHSIAGTTKVRESQSGRAINSIKAALKGRAAWTGGQPENFFDVDADNRPIIDYESHNGNSHLFVYESVDPKILENEILRYTGTSKIEKIQYPFVFDAFSPIKTEKNHYYVRKSHQHPFFVDLLMANVYTTEKTQNAAVNALKNGTYNQQIGLRVSVPLKGNMSVFAGLGYMNQILHYRGDYLYDEAYTKINTKVTFINDPIKGVIRVETKDTVSGIAAKSKAVDFKNSYSMLRMPLGLGYNFGVGKFDFTLHGSADVNMITYAKVNTMLQEANTIIKTSNTRSLHLGAGMSFMAAYRISSKFKLIAEPGVNYLRLKGANTGNFTNEKIYNFTATLGIRYSVF